MDAPALPQIIQGGMGAGVSNWRLAKAVSSAGHLGVVSGTGLDLIIARRLQQGDPGGHIARALAHFPLPAVAKRIMDTWFVPGGKADSKPYRSKPVLALRPSALLEQLLVVSSFVEVWLAREGHDGLVGINLLEKIQAPTLPTLYGAMLAGVAFVLIGAGIPRHIPGVLDRLARGESVDLKLDVADALPGEDFLLQFDPLAFLGQAPPQLDRPRFLAIIASSTLATSMLRKSNGRVDGFVVEGHTAGGHNAPPRGVQQVNAAGEPIYGERDIVDLDQMKALGAPFWLAGSYGDPEGLARALAAGATGIQVGTAFAYCEESGMDTAVKQRVLEASRTGTMRVLTDALASPTGFPIKAVQLTDTHSDPEVYAQRTRICDLGYLRKAYRRENGVVGWRCPSEPVADYIAKGGLEADTVGRKCICNGLMAAIGQPQVRKDGNEELSFVTSGDRVTEVADFLEPGATSYRAQDVLDRLLAQVRAGPTSPRASR
ncbi:MAG: nitronate monooxygenase [Planctomycetota bacterium]|nr:nitronate monooxygenase [Planctomycetota bacterium]